MSPRAAIHLIVAAVLLLVAGPALAQDGGWDEGRTPEAGGYDVQVDVDASPVTLETFQSGLSAHGEWVSSGAYGMAWRPRVAAGWRPYYYGRWEWTNEGWLWVSEEPFGWATYHYGRWAFDRGTGWLWVPGYQWAPAWVSWRFGGDVVGWAPLAPGLSLYVTSYAFVDFWWTFVPSVRFCGTPIWGVAYAPSRAYQFYGVTTPAPPRSRPPPVGWGSRAGSVRPPPAGRAAPAWGGPPPRYIEERTGRAVVPSRIVAEPRPGAVRGRAGEIGVFRPELAPRGAARPWPAQRPGAGAAPWRGPGERSGPRQLAPPVGPRPEARPVPAGPRPEARPQPAGPRPEARPVPAPRGSAAPSSGAAPRAGGAPRAEAPPPSRAAPPARTPPPSRGASPGRDR